jgi:hypothetical protein
VKTLSVEIAARNFDTLVEEVERDQVEVTLLRKRKKVARLVPEARGQNALEVFGDLFGILERKASDGLLRGIARSRRGKNSMLNGLRNPWRI